MSAIYFAIPTDAGQAKMANAIALGIPLKITHMAVGDGNGQPVTPNAAQTALIRENRRAPLNTLFQDPLNQAQLVAEQIIPEDVGAWWIREVGIFSEDGTLIAVANCPDTYKPLLSSGAGRTQVIRLVLVVSDTSAVELKIDPSVVLATRKYVDDVMKAHRESRDHPDASKIQKGMIRLATETEALAGLLESVAVAPKDMKAALEALLDIVCPIGIPMPWPAATPPGARFLLANGQSFNKATYPKLGALWPSGVIPFDMRGQFLRGWDNGKGFDPGRELLSYQGSENQAHRHNLLIKKTAGSAELSISGLGALTSELSALGRNVISPSEHLELISGVQGSVDGPIKASGGSESRPRNIAFNFILRAA